MHGIDCECDECLDIRWRLEGDADDERDDDIPEENDDD